MKDTNWHPRKKEDSPGISYWVTRYNPKAEINYLGNEYVMTKNHKRKRYNSFKAAKTIADALNLQEGS